MSNTGKRRTGIQRPSGILMFLISDATGITQRSWAAPVFLESSAKLYNSRGGVEMRCPYAKSTDEFYGWKCGITGGECELIFPDEKYCTALDDDPKEDVPG